jgi:hypothetical protein
MHQNDRFQTFDIQLVTAQCAATAKQSGLADRCPKNGDVPKSPFPQLAAVVPSVGKISLAKSKLLIAAHPEETNSEIKFNSVSDNSCGMRHVSQSSRGCGRHHSI